MPRIENNTRVYIANPSPLNNQITVCQYRPSGGDFFDKLDLNLLPNEYESLGYDDIGSLCVTSQYPVLVSGDLERADSSDNKLGESLTGIGEFHNNLIAPHVASSTQWSTELLLANANDRETVVRIEAYDTAGELKHSVYHILADHGSYARKIRDIFPLLMSEEIAYLKIAGTIDARLAGQLLFYTNEGQGEVMGGAVLYPNPGKP